MPTESWAQSVDPYDGPLRGLYRAGVQVLRDAYPEYTAAAARAETLRRRAERLNLASTILAATATITILPEDVSRWISAVIAFLAAAASGYVTTVDPAGKALTEHGRAVDSLQLRDDVRRTLRLIATLGDTPEARAEVEKALAAHEAERNRILSNRPGATGGGTPSR